jgi:mono/diheme cytochrome c family protein
MQPNHFFRNCAVFLLAIVALCGSRGVAGESLQRPSGSDGAVAATESSAAGLAGFRRDVEPVLQAACLECHGPDASEGNFRVDTIDPDLIHGEDLEWWRDVFAVLTKEEMPPVDADPLADADRVRVVNWLARELQQASRAQRAAGGRSSLRRMTRYEFGLTRSRRTVLKMEPTRCRFRWGSLWPFTKRLARRLRERLSAASSLRRDTGRSPWSRGRLACGPTSQPPRQRSTRGRTTSSVPQVRRR